MKINIDFFVVRFLSKSMGFDDKTSKIIANASQFLNDSKTATSVHFDRKDIYGKKIEKRGLFSNDGDGIKVLVPQTIFNSFSDFDIKNKFSWKTMVPFHYPPYSPLSSHSEECYAYEVETPNLKDTLSVLGSQVKYVIEQFQKQNLADFDDDIETAIRIGVLSHMMLSSFAHRKLNGFVSDTNDTQVVQVMSGDRSSYVTENYLLLPEEIASVPNVGDYRIKNVLDETNLQVNFVQKSYIPPRQTICDTLSVSLDAAKCVYDFFLLLFNKKDENYSVWKGTFLPVISEMLKEQKNDFDSLKTKWDEKCKELCIDVDFSYQTTDVIKKLTDKVDVRYLFGAAVVADDIRKCVVVGNKLLFQQNNSLPKATNHASIQDVLGSIEFSEVKLDGTEFTVSAKGIIGDSDKVRMLSIVLYNDAFQTVASKQYVSEDGANSIEGSFTGKIPSSERQYTLQAELYSVNKKKTAIAKKSQTICIQDVSKIIQCKVSNPYSDTDAVVQVSYNQVDHNSTRYSYHDNADYYNQDNQHQIDVFLPVSVLLSIDEKYSIISIEPTLSFSGLTDPFKGTLFLHCGNEQKNKITISKNKKSCAIEYSPEWKNVISIQNISEQGMMCDLKLNLTLKVNVDHIPGYSGNLLFTWDTIGKNIFKPINITWNTTASRR